MEAEVTLKFRCGNSAAVDYAVKSLIEMIRHQNPKLSDWSINVKPKESE